MEKEKKWEIKNKLKIKHEKSKIDEIIHLLLENRSLKTPEEIENFLHPKLEGVTIDAVGLDKKQVKKTLERIKKSIDNKERIIIFGDYDVDGITATAILWETLHGLGADVLPYIPHRVDEGYGLSVKGIEHVLEKHPDTKLIITVDNGIVAAKPVAFANEQNIDVI